MNIVGVNIEHLGEFLYEAVRHAYAGKGREIFPWTPGLRELEYPENAWGKSNGYYYRDSYAGFYRFAGREIVYLCERPVWIRNYYGGMLPEYQGDKDFSEATFNILRTALSNVNPVCPFWRGPANYQWDQFLYTTFVIGDIGKFSGEENIYYRKINSGSLEVVYRLQYEGGLIIG